MALNEKEFAQLAHAIAPMDGYNINGAKLIPLQSVIKLLAQYSEPGLTIRVEFEKNGTVSWSFDRPKGKDNGSQG